VVELGLTPALRDTLALVYPSSTQRYIDRAQQSVPGSEHPPGGCLNSSFFCADTVGIQRCGSIAVMEKLHQVVL